MNPKVYRNQAKLMNASNRKRMYKKGKQWIVASSLFLSLLAGGSLLGVYADSVQPQAKANTQTSNLNRNQVSTQGQHQQAKVPAQNNQAQQKVSTQAANLHNHLLNNSNNTYNKGMSKLANLQASSRQQLHNQFNQNNTRHGLKSTSTDTKKVKANNNQQSDLEGIAFVGAKFEYNNNQKTNNLDITHNDVGTPFYEDVKSGSNNGISANQLAGLVPNGWELAPSSVSGKATVTNLNNKNIDVSSLENVNYQDFNDGLDDVTNKEHLIPVVSTAQDHIDVKENPVDIEGTVYLNIPNHAPIELPYSVQAKTNSDVNVLNFTNPKANEPSDYAEYLDQYFNQSSYNKRNVTGFSFENRNSSKYTFNLKPSDFKNSDITTTNYQNGTRLLHKDVELNFIQNNAKENINYIYHGNIIKNKNNQFISDTKGGTQGALVDAPTNNTDLSDAGYYVPDNSTFTFSDNGTADIPVLPKSAHAEIEFVNPQGSQVSTTISDYSGNDNRASLASNTSMPVSHINPNDIPEGYHIATSKSGSAVGLNGSIPFNNDKGSSTNNVTEIVVVPNTATDNIIYEDKNGRILGEFRSSGSTATSSLAINSSSVNSESLPTGYVLSNGESKLFPYDGSTHVVQLSGSSVSNDTFNININADGQQTSSFSVPLSAVGDSFTIYPTSYAPDANYLPTKSDEITTITVSSNGSLESVNGQSLANRAINLNYNNINQVINTKAPNLITVKYVNQDGNVIKTGEINKPKNVTTNILSDVSIPDDYNIDTSKKISELDNSTNKPDNQVPTFDKQKNTINIKADNDEHTITIPVVGMTGSQIASNTNKINKEINDILNKMSQSASTAKNNADKASQAASESVNKYNQDIKDIQNEIAQDKSKANHDTGTKKDQDNKDLTNLEKQLQQDLDALNKAKANSTADSQTDSKATTNSESANNIDYDDSLADSLSTLAKSVSSLANFNSQSANSASSSANSASVSASSAQTSANQAVTSAGRKNDSKALSSANSADDSAISASKSANSASQSANSASTSASAASSSASSASSSTSTEANELNQANATAKLNYDASTYVTIIEQENGKPVKSYAKLIDESNHSTGDTVIIRPSDSDIEPAGFSPDNSTQDIIGHMTSKGIELLPSTDTFVYDADDTQVNNKGKDGNNDAIVIVNQAKNQLPAPSIYTGAKNQPLSNNQIPKGYQLDPKYDYHFDNKGQLVGIEFDSKTNKPVTNADGTPVFSSVTKLHVIGDKVNGKANIILRYIVKNADGSNTGTVIHKADDAQVVFNGRVGDTVHFNPWKYFKDNYNVPSDQSFTILSDAVSAQYDYGQQYNPNLKFYYYANQAAPIIINYENADDNYNNVGSQTFRDFKGVAGDTIYLGSASDTSDNEPNHYNVLQIPTGYYLAGNSVRVVLKPAAIETVNGQKQPKPLIMTVDLHLGHTNEQQAIDTINFNGDPVANTDEIGSYGETGSIDAPVGYHFTNGSNGTFTFSDKTHNFDVEPNDPTRTDNNVVNYNLPNGASMKSFINTINGTNNGKNNTSNSATPTGNGQSIVNNIHTPKANSNEAITKIAKHLKQGQSIVINTKNGKLTINNKRTNTHYRWLYVIKPILLHRNIDAIGSKRDAIKAIKPKHKFYARIIGIYKLMGHGRNFTRYEISVKIGKYYRHVFVTGNPEFVRNAYYQLANLHHAKKFHHKYYKARIIAPAFEYKGRFYTRRTRQHLMRVDKTVYISRIVRIGRKGDKQTKFELTNGNYITANKNFIKLI